MRTRQIHLVSGEEPALLDVVEAFEAVCLDLDVTPDAIRRNRCPPAAVGLDGGDGGATDRDGSEGDPARPDWAAPLSPSLLAVVGENASRVSYARITGPYVLGRVVRERVPGDAAVGLQVDDVLDGRVTGRTVYHYDPAAAAYVETPGN